MTTTPAPDLNAALKILDRLRAAAPPVAARRLDQVVAALEHLREENAALAGRLAQVETGAAQNGHVDDFDAQFRTILEERAAGFTDGHHAGIANALSELTDEERASLVAYLSDGARRPRPFGHDLLIPPPDDLPTDVPPEPAQTGAITDLPGDDILLMRASESLRSPLIGLRGQAESLLGGRNGRISPEMRTALALMQDGADGALALIDSLETLRALRDDRLEIRYSTFAPGALVRAATAQFERQAASQDNIMTLVVDESLPDVYADFAAALVILSDLIDNALRYTPPGGATRVSAERLGAHVLFTVADTGIGITDEDYAHIGQLFWRAVHQPLVRQHTGTGLRLFLARSILDRMGGELFFSGDPGLGSSFSFTLSIAI